MTESSVPNATPEFYFRRAIAGFYARQPGATAAFCAITTTLNLLSDVTEQPNVRKLAIRDARFLIALTESDPLLHGWELFTTIAATELSFNDLAISAEHLQSITDRFLQETDAWWVDLDPEIQNAAFFELTQVLGLFNDPLPREIQDYARSALPPLLARAADHLRNLLAGVAQLADTEQGPAQAELYAASYASAFKELPTEYLPIALPEGLFASLPPESTAHTAFQPPEMAFTHPCIRRLGFQFNPTESPYLASQPSVDELTIADLPLAFSPVNGEAHVTCTYVLSQRILASLGVMPRGDSDEIRAEHVLEDATRAAALGGRAQLNDVTATKPEEFRSHLARIQSLWPELPRTFEPFPTHPPLTISIDHALSRRELEWAFLRITPDATTRSFLNREIVESFLLRELHELGPWQEDVLAEIEAEITTEQRFELSKLFPDAYAA